ncbi:hypothetical protein B0H16DRAFT_1585624 [Mycena metata]|uniref:Uncharacterized protein n=1 Tax=Mycena metata TaxID=1033252 RepID=A0AAD7MMX9_9AGAR|nr:hypothetical protein B0H16DRAFT_1595772 [Mycena metata]KAJ7730169.1 hypothetical protein B0H16DRAFT_1585624 [Mycena metata]
MADSSSFAPPGESSLDLWIERSNLNGVLLSAVAYGILFTLTFQTLLIFLQLPRAKIPWGFVGYICAMFILASLGFGGNAKFNQMTFIDDRNIPGGPNAFTVEFYSTWVNMMSFAAYVLMSWLADGLVLWRFTLIWGWNYWISFFPTLIYLGAVGSSIALMRAIMSSTDLTFWGVKSVQFSIAYWSLSISLNVILTLAIACRIWLVRRRTRQSLGFQHSGQYVSVSAMLVESAALYSTWGLVFLICYARNTPLQNILLPPLGQVQGIAPVLILFRVAQGRAWSESTAANATSRYNNRSIPLTTLTSGESRGDDQLKISMTTVTSQWEGDKV